MASPAKVLLDRLTGGGFTAAQVSHSHMPDALEIQDTFVYLRDTSGPGPLETHDIAGGGDGRTNRPGLICISRAPDEDTARSNAELARSLLRGYNFTLGGVTFQSVVPGDIHSMGWDSSGKRRLVTFNVDLMISE